MRLSPIFAIASLVMLSPASSTAAPDLVRTLPNKVTLVVREVRTRPIVSIQAWVRAGTRDEATKDRGLAITTAQCIMEASTRRDPGMIQKEVFAIGGHFQSEAGYDYSYFDLAVPARYVAQGLGLLADGLAHARLDASVLGSAITRASSTARTALREPDRASVNSLRA